jgi:hypothetical protein
VYRFEFISHTPHRVIHIYCQFWNDLRCAYNILWIAGENNHKPNPAATGPRRLWPKGSLRRRPQTVLPGGQVDLCGLPVYITKSRAE